MNNFVIKNRLDLTLCYLLSFALFVLSLRLLLDPEAITMFQQFEQPAYARLLLGGGEIAATILFVFGLTRIWGGLGLLAVFAYAAYIHLGTGQFPLALIPWTIGVLLVLYFTYRRKSTPTTIE